MLQLGKILDRFRDAVGPVWGAAHRNLILRAVNELDRAADIGVLLEVVAA